MLLVEYNGESFSMLFHQIIRNVTDLSHFVSSPRFSTSYFSFPFSLSRRLIFYNVHYNDIDGMCWHKKILLFPTPHVFDE